MAHLLTKEEFAALDLLDHVWVESVMDDGRPREYEVIMGDGLVKGMRTVGTPVIVGRTFNYAKRGGSVRFWSAMPSEEQALSTPWFADRKEG